MSNANFANLHTAIVAKLNTLVGVGKPLGIVYPYHEALPTSYPAASVEMSALGNDFFTTTDNLRAYSFDIFLYQEFSSATLGRQEAASILMACVDATVKAFDSDFSLGGACDYSKPLPMSSGYAVIGDGSILWAQLTLVCYAEIDPSV